jgi:hypothetical protein
MIRRLNILLFFCIRNVYPICPTDRDREDSFARKSIIFIAVIAKHKEPIPEFHEVIFTCFTLHHYPHPFNNSQVPPKMVKVFKQPITGPRIKTLIGFIISKMNWFYLRRTLKNSWRAVSSHLGFVEGPRIQLFFFF